MTSFKNLLCAFALITAVNASVATADGLCPMTSAPVQYRFPHCSSSGYYSYEPLESCFDRILAEWQVNQCNPCSPEYGEKREALLMEAKSIRNYSQSLLYHDDCVQLDTQYAQRDILDATKLCAIGALVGTVVSVAAFKSGFFAHGIRAAASVIVPGVKIEDSLIAAGIQGATYLSVGTILGAVGTALRAHGEKSSPPTDYEYKGLSRLKEKINRFLECQGVLD